MLIPKLKKKVSVLVFHRSGRTNWLHIFVTASRKRNSELTQEQKKKKRKNSEVHLPKHKKRSINNLGPQYIALVINIVFIGII